MAKMIPTDKINFYIDLLIKEVENLEKYKCDSFTSQVEFKKLMCKTSSLEKINTIIHNLAYDEWINK